MKYISYILSRTFILFLIIGTSPVFASYLPTNTGGNVGINSLSPGKTLDVQGTVRATYFSGDGSGLTNISSNSGWTLGASNVGISTTNNVGIGTNLTTTAGLTVMNGNVGIGTWKPSSQLSVNGTISSGPVYLSGLPSSTGSSSVVSIGASACGSGFSCMLLNGNHSFMSLVGAGGWLGLGGGTSNPYQIYMSGSSPYNVGINTTSPGSNFSVLGNVSVGSFATATPPVGGLIVSGNVGVGSAAPGSRLDVQGTLRVLNGNVGIGTSFTTQAGLSVMTGYVGIGTWAPVAVLQAYQGVSDFRFSEGASNLTPNMAVISTTGKAAALLAGTNGSAFNFDNSGFFNIVGDSHTNFVDNNLGLGQEYLRITSEGNLGLGTTIPEGGLVVMNGNVGIGTWIPARTLDVTGTVRATYFVGDGSGLTGVSGSSSGWTLGASNVGISTTNNVGIGSSAPGQKLDVQGTVRSKGLTIGSFANNGATEEVIASGNGAVAVGRVSASSFTSRATSSGSGSLAVGYLDDADGGDALLTSSGLGSLAMGYVSGVDGNGSLISSGQGSVAIGSSTSSSFLSSGTGSIAMGLADNGTLQSTGTGSVAIGTNVQATANNAFAFGSSFINNSINTFKIGFSSTPTVTVTTTNVGIGSITPGKQLDVQGTVRASYFVGDGSGLTGVSGSSSGWTLGASNVGISTTNNVGIGSSAPGEILDIQGTVRILSGGNLGIGTTSIKHAKLEVTGNGSTELMRVNDSGQNDTTPFIITSSGNVGIGSAVPLKTLEVGGTGLQLTNIDSGQNNGANGIRIITSTAGLGAGVQMGNATTGASSVWQFFSKGGTLDFAIGRANVQDNILLGGTSGAPKTFFAGPNAGATMPAGSFTIMASAGTDATYVPIVARGNASQTANLQEWQNSSGTALAVVSSNGNMGIGSSAPGQLLDIQGTVRLLGGGNLGIGTAVARARLEINNTAIFSKEYDEGSEVGAFTVDWNNGNKQKVTVTGTALDITFTDPPGVTNLTLKIIQGDGNDTIDWTNEASIKWPAGTAPTLSTASGAIDFISCYFDGTYYYCVPSLNFQ